MPETPPGSARFIGRSEWWGLGTFDLRITIPEIGPRDTMKEPFSSAPARTMPTAPAVLPEADTESATRRQPPYAVLIHNDDHNGMDFVVEVLNKVFSYPLEKCVLLMKEAHEAGLAVVWVGALEVAELKAEQIVSCGADPRSMAPRKAPLRVTIEPTE